MVGYLRHMWRYVNASNYWNGNFYVTEVNGLVDYRLVPSTILTIIQIWEKVTDYI